MVQHIPVRRGQSDETAHTIAVIRQFRFSFQRRVGDAAFATELSS
jgi:hypothetical protein